jgi:hypothetical protein
MNRNDLYRLFWDSPHGSIVEPFNINFDIDATIMWERIELILNEMKLNNTFVKKDNIKPLEFIKIEETKVYEPLDMNDVDVIYLRNMLLKSLQIPNEYFDNTNLLTPYSDEYH